MTREQLIAQARELRHDFDADLAGEAVVVKAALNEIQLHGFADEASGDVEASCGFFFRVDRWVVVVDGDARATVDEHANPTYAREHFNALDHAYADWLPYD